MNSLAAALADIVEWRTLLVPVVCYSVMPYAVLWVVVRCWPKDNDRRREYLAEYDAVPMYRRPFWVGDAAIRSLTDGLAARRGAYLRRKVRVSLPRPSRPSTRFWHQPSAMFPVRFLPPMVVAALIQGTGLPDWPSLFLGFIAWHATIEGGASGIYTLRLVRWTRNEARVRALAVERA